MSLVGFKAQNHPQQAVKPNVDDRSTPTAFFEMLDARFHFTVDVAAASHNTRCARFYSIEDDGLKQSWAGEHVWCNPPYSDLRPWIEKASRETDALVVQLIPANRTEQPFWQQFVEPVRDRGGRLSTEFVAGRIRFGAHEAQREATLFSERGEQIVPPNSRPPFGCCLLIWERVGVSENSPNTETKP